MALPDLTNQNIQDTYQRVVQKANDGQLRDGTGSAMPIKIEGNNVRISGSLIAEQYVVSSSVTNITTQQLSGSTEFGDSIDDTHTFNGDITASRHISSSGNIFSDKVHANLIAGKVDGSGIVLGSESDIHVTASGNISAAGNISSSGYIYGSRYYINQELGLTYHAASSTYRLFNIDDSNIGVGAYANQNSRINLWGSVTASGDISASGNIKASQYAVDGYLALNSNSTTGRVFSGQGSTAIEIGRTGGTNKNISLFGPVTASGDISASGIVIADSASFGHLRLGTRNTSTGDSIILRHSTGSSGGVIDFVSGDYALYQGDKEYSLRIRNAHESNGGEYIHAPNTKVFGIEVIGDIYAKDFSGTGVGSEPEGRIFAQGSITTETNVTASRNISASGYIYGDRIYPDSSDKFLYSDTNSIISFANSFWSLGHITASNDISASGTVTAGTGSFNHLSGDTNQDTGLQVLGAITASAGISASGDIYGDRLVGTIVTGQQPNIQTIGTISAGNVTAILPSGILSGSAQLPSGILSGSAQLPSGILSGSVDLENHLVLPPGVVSSSAQLPSGIISSSQHVFSAVTASGDISASGNITTTFVDAKTSGTGYKLSGAKALYTHDNSTVVGRTARLTLTGSSARFGRAGDNMHVTASGNISASGYIYAGGDIHAVGDVIASSTTPSDYTLKRNIEDIDNPIKIIKELTGKSFNWKKTGEFDYGLIAQEVEKILPELVKEKDNISGEGTKKVVKYISMVPILIESIKELSNKNDSLEQKLNKLIEEVDKLKNMG